MTKKIFRSIVVVAVAVMLSCLILFTGVLYSYFTSRQRDLIKEQAKLMALGTENEGMSYLSGIKDTLCRITLVSRDGTVLFDNRADALSMENHKERVEIVQALDSGSGESSRLSSTLTKRTLYYALRLEDGSVLRTAVTQDSVVSLLLGALQPLLAVLAFALILAFVLASRLSRRLVEPINKLNLESPLENDSYEELSPLLARIEKQRRKIDAQLSELAAQREELGAVTDNMSEGLVLLDKTGAILSMNNAAMRILGVKDECVGLELTGIERGAVVRGLVGLVLSGKHAEAEHESGGRVYRLSASPVLAEGTQIGACVFAVDDTDRSRAETLRREFAANVSHELKTPLHAIMGTAELMENGLVKAEDMPRFIGRIRSEAERLVTLIHDILRLSQLDEGVTPPVEPVELYGLCAELLSKLEVEAESCGVSLALEGDRVTLPTVRAMATELIFNLMDNAIKYNREGGHVWVRVESQAESVRLVVKDDGIGIPKEHQARVFERFYRVDKSHSRDSGGTGLGLSIVKHAARCLGAKLKLESTAGQGTEISVSFPKIG